MSISVILELNIKPEFIADFEAGIKQAFPETRAFPGCISVNACRHESRPNTYLFLEHWREQADYENYIKWRTETAFMEQLMAIIASPPVSRVLQVVA
ncbi:MAG: antibiotic biosynthesis monooxygenase subfamily protein [Verrucomicrobiaceae bacterium]|nr:antibiotic biosynthesis monooxygenase subfamily protein [Verrucomicrobiaceae bacterium]